MTQNSALSALFDAQEPKKGKAKVQAQPKAPKAQPVEKKEASTANKVICSECGSEVWPFHTKDGVCNDCAPKAKAQPKAQPEPKAEPQAKPTPAKGNGKMKKAQKNTSENRQAGLESDHWHDKEATFKQTSRLRKETGLKTWDLETSLTRFEASAMISEIEKGNGGVDDVTKILVEKFGCEVYVRPGKAQGRPVPAESQNVDRDTAAELVALKRQIRGLKSANTRLKKSA